MLWTRETFVWGIDNKNDKEFTKKFILQIWIFLW